MTMTRSHSILLGGIGVTLLIAAHGVAVWGGVALSGTAAGWLPWVGGGAVAFGLYHLVQGFGLYHVVQHIRGRAGDHSHRSSTQSGDRAHVDRGPHDGFLVDLGHGFVELTVCHHDSTSRFRLFLYDKRKQPRAVPKNATITIETVRSGDERQAFAFYSAGEYLESTTAVPEPHEFTAYVHVSHGKHTHTHTVRVSDREAR